MQWYSLFDSASEFPDFISLLTGAESPSAFHHRLLDYLQIKAIIVTAPIRDIFKALGGYIEIIRVVPVRRELVKIMRGTEGEPGGDREMSSVWQVSQKQWLWPKLKAGR